MDAARRAPVLGNHERLTLLFENLLDEAVARAGSLGAVSVRLSRVEGEAVLEIRSGFDGRRTDAPAEDGQDGALAARAVAAIVEGHGGTIVRGAGDADGLALRLCLPLAAGDADEWPVPEWRGEPNELRRAA